jgi:DNA-binding winged helix-turn-helix (wHTH) protein/TolB-like protein/Tfp pilus assembly protein PilF
MSTSVKRFYQYGPYCIDAERRMLSCEGVAKPMSPKAFDTLLVLVQHPGMVLEKDQLMEMLWPDSVVEEANLAQNISSLRKALGESPNERRYIITVPGRGYRFAADVKEFDPESERPPLEGSTNSDVVQKQQTPLVKKDHAFGRSRTLTGGLIVLLISILVGVAIWMKSSTAPSGTTSEIAVKSLAVLPFKQLGSEGDDYIGLGIADSLITRLTNLRAIKVRPTSAVLKYNDQSPEPSRIGRELGVEAVLEGSVRKNGDIFRISVQLVRVDDGTPIWAEQFDDQFTSIFKFEDIMSRRVAESLVPKLTGTDRAALAKSYTGNADAYADYLRGRFFWNKRTVEGMNKAIEHFESAIVRDPNYALAYAGLADCYLMLFSYSDYEEKEKIPKAKAAAIRAVQLDQTLSEAHTSLAFVLQNDHNNSDAEREYKKAIDLNPNYSTAYLRYGNMKISMGQPDEALQIMKRAQELDPLSLIINTALGHDYSLNRRYDEAVAQLLKTVELDPSFVHSHCFLSMAYLKKGMYGNAIKEIEEATVLSEKFVPPQVVSYRGYIYAVTGRRADAKRILKELMDHRIQRHVSGPHIALIYTGLGETDQAFSWLETALREQELGFSWLSDPGFDDLRSDPRYDHLARRIRDSQ